MKNVNVKNFLKQRRALGGLAAFATAIVIGGTAFFQNVNQVPEFPEFMDPAIVTTIEEEETPLASAPKVTTKTSSKTTKKKVKIATAAPRTYTKKLATQTKTSTKESTTKTSNITTQTTVKTETTEKYTKQSKTKAVTTKVTTTVTTTTVDKGAAKPIQATYQTGPVDVETIAPMMDTRVKNAYKTLGFSVVLDANVPYSGYFNAKAQTTTINSKQLALASDTIYHELGHFLAFIAGNVDTKPDFAAIYAAEKGNLTGATSAYATQNPSEYFADCVRLYTVSPSSLKASCPRTYSAIENALNGITDSRISMIQRVYGPYWK